MKPWRDEDQPQWWSGSRADSEAGRETGAVDRWTGWRTTHRLVWSRPRRLLVEGWEATFVIWENPSHKCAYIYIYNIYIYIYTHSICMYRKNTYVIVTPPMSLVVAPDWLHTGRHNMSQWPPSGCVGMGISHTWDYEHQSAASHHKTIIRPCWTGKYVALAVTSPPGQSKKLDPKGDEIRTRSRANFCLRWRKYPLHKGWNAILCIHKSHTTSSQTLRGPSSETLNPFPCASLSSELARTNDSLPETLWWGTLGLETTRSDFKGKFEALKTLALRFKSACLLLMVNCLYYWYLILMKIHPWWALLGHCSEKWRSARGRCSRVENAHGPFGELGGVWTE